MKFRNTLGKAMLLIVVNLLLSMSVLAQLISFEKGQYDEIKSAKVHFVLTGNLFFDTEYKLAILETWTFSSYDFITQDEFISKCTNDTEYFVVVNSYSASREGSMNKSATYNARTNSMQTTYSMGLSYNDAYTALSLIKGNKKKTKINSKDFKDYVNYRDWIAFMVNDKVMVGFNADYWRILNAKEDKRWYADPITYKIRLDIQSLQFLLNYSKIDPSVKFKLGNLYYSFPRLSYLKESTLYCLEEDVTEFKLEELKAMYPYKIEITSRIELVKMAKEKKENAVLIDFSSLGDGLSQYSVVDIKNGELLYYNFLRSTENWKWMFFFLRKKLK